MVSQRLANHSDFRICIVLFNLIPDADSQFLLNGLTKRKIPKSGLAPSQREDRTMLLWYCPKRWNSKSNTTKIF